MAVWLARAGRRGERENLAFDQNVSVIGWTELPDLSPCKTREDIYRLLEDTYPDKTPESLRSWLSQLNIFRFSIQQGDIIALPLKSRSAVAFGEVTGPYTFIADNPADARHARPVNWLKEIPRSAIDQDILYSLGSAMTVAGIKRNDSEARIRTLLKGTSVKIEPKEVSEENGDTEDTIPDLESLARDQIIEHISKNFRGHQLARLVGAILEAQGYRIQVSPPGADGGVDIVAGKGLLGFDAPRIVVQVKSSDSPTDVKPVRELQGIMDHVRADHGLFVSWGGYTSPVIRETSSQFFKIRLWDANDLVSMIQNHYTELPEEIQAELPLKRVWMLVGDE